MTDASCVTPGQTLGACHGNEVCVIDAAERGQCPHDGLACDSLTDCASCSDQPSCGWCESSARCVWARAHRDDFCVAPTGSGCQPWQLVTLSSDLDCASPAGDSRYRWLYYGILAALAVVLVVGILAARRWWRRNAAAQDLGLHQQLPSQQSTARTQRMQPVVADDDDGQGERWNGSDEQWDSVSQTRQFLVPPGSPGTWARRRDDSTADDVSYMTL